MKIISGIFEGSVLQRGQDNLCEVEIEVQGAKNLTCSIGELEQKSDSVWIFRGIPSGGPYSVTFSDGLEEITVHDFYIGDVWVLGGQSNMDGSARVTAEDLEYAKNPQTEVRAFYMDESWRPACYDMHNKLIAKEQPYIDSCVRWVEGIEQSGIRVYDAPPYRLRRCVGPGVAFAREMFRLTGGVPQGLIPCAVGGAPIEMWLPTGDGSENYYTAALHRIKLCGNRIRGMFWAQGEGNPNWEIYPEQIETIRSGICKQTGMECLPFVQLQSFRCTMDRTEEAAFGWSRFREMQRRMQEQCLCLATIATNDCSLDDGIHLDSASQQKMGVRGANAMYHLVTGCGFAQPTIESISAMPEQFAPDSFTVLKIRYKNLDGALRSLGVPNGFTMSRAEEKPSNYHLCQMSLHQNEVHILVEEKPENLKNYQLWYGFGHDFYCNITDGAGRAIPAMGPILLRDYLEKQCNK